MREMICQINLAKFLYGVFPGPLGQFSSVTYPRRLDHVTRKALAARNNEG